MGIVIYFAVLFVIGILGAYLIDRGKQKDLQQGIYANEELIHLGGYPYLQQNDKIRIKVKKDNIEIYRYGYEQLIGNPIPISQIKNIQIKNEEEIQKDVTLTRLLALGIFAFALPKKTSINNQYLFLQYEEKGVNINCLFKSTNNTNTGNLLSTINRIKLESSV